MKAFLILEDGTVFEGKHIGADKDVVSEIVFNTSMAGYTEVFTDPSYAGQAVCMTYPLIGNYGVCLDDMESDKIWVDAVIVRELSHIPSNFRCDMSIQEFLEKYEIPGIEGIDTRKLVRILREKGTMNGFITTNENIRFEDVKDRLNAYTTGDVVSKVSCKEKKFLKGVEDISENGAISGSASFNKDDYEACQKGDLSKREKKPSIVRELNGKGLKVALLDFGAKRNIAASLAARGCDVTIYPSDTSAEEILKDAPDGIMLSNGPGDPKECTQIIKEIKKLYDSDMPIFAICLGHQLMALATGADTFKMKYGHRGGNHPVKDLSNNRVYISSQNHGYVVDMDKLDPNVAKPAFINVNDGTNEGLSYVGKNIFTVQFHPEACPGPQDSSYLFDRFITMIKEGGKN
ncbi:MAG: carbamoyl phosphate synthase small subunit [Butyrivibrio sp.]|uniref:carbamoyl phosphate synthase small subunit n=1 Tax=Butyrivibrio sp. TaxID=28121 RepID=UPI001B1874AA|nr:carbamoyl phosphate synthase small subunit [Butyrivibrio sp.]MBO6240344.1 carbamoyl phosphate synthase small subunit [Butyrivibrio sp.]